MRLATLTKTQQSAPFAQAEQKQLASLSCSCALDAVIRNDSRLQRGAPAAQLDCSSKVSAPVPSDCVHGANGNCRWFKTAFRDSSRLFGYTAIFVFFFFLVRLLRPHSASTTPAQIGYDTDKSWSLSENTNCVLGRIYFACICVPGSS